MSETILITGAGGYVGKLVVAELARSRGQSGADEVIIATDLALPAASVQGVEYFAFDVRDPDLQDFMVERGVDVVIHLAAIVSPKPGEGEALARSVDVEGTRNVLQGCVKAKARKIIVTSSGAAYGYHADSDVLLTEQSPIRGNEAFAYSRHKRIVEGLLAEYREAHPALAQLIFRPCTILGADVSNQITAIFDKPVVVGLSDAATPFCFIWDQDVVACLCLGARNEAAGIYNLAADGVMTLREIAGALGKRFVGLKSGHLSVALRLLKRFDLTRYGPEQVRFLQYRPVLSNARLKAEFGYQPQRTSREVFELYRASHA